MAKRKHEDNYLTGFFAHGILRTDKIIGNQYISTCRFCQKKDKFYINISNLCWDCKVCGRNGNFQVFLKEVAQQNSEMITVEEMKALADNRGLPLAAFDGWEVGFDGSKYTLPMYDFNGNITDLKSYHPGHSLLGTKGGKQSLINAPRLKEFDGDVVYVCEGQWDVFALNWLVTKLHKKGLVVGVPGANNFNENWIDYFYNKTVYLCYDHDEPGIKGEAKAFGLLTPVAKKIEVLYWPESKPEGYDIRDFIRFLAVKKKKPKRAFRRIMEMMEGVPRSVRNFASTGRDGELVLDERRQEKLEPITFDELVATYRKWLYMPNVTPLKVMFASILANRIPGEMLWIFLVGAPSSLKTELIRSLSMCPQVEMVSTLTPRTLVSGFLTQNKQDVSLLRVLNNRVLAIKDYTSVLTLNPIARDEIHGQLRDVYDGQIDKMFGHGQHRRFKVRFGIVGAVTATIEKFGLMQQTLGERFLRYILPKDVSENAIMSKLKRATGNISHEDDMRKEIGMAAKRFLGMDFDMTVEMPPDIGNKIHFLSRFTALLRGFVERDFKGNVLYRPDSESPARLSKQLFKLGMGLAIVESQPIVTEEHYRTLRDIAVGTCPGRIESTVHVLFNCKRPMKLREISDQTEFPIFTVKNVLDDLVMLKLVRLEGGFKGYYFLSEMCQTLIREAEVYPPALTLKLKKLPLAARLAY